MFTLGIETSCDETSAAVVCAGHRVLSNVVASQVNLHAKWGGVVPEAAARRHVERVNAVIQQALDEAQCGWERLNGIAVTNRPGLVGALVVGLAAAKALAFALNLPFVGVNHLEGHLYSPFLELDKPVPFPHVCLIVSGGHTELLLAKGHGQYEWLGQTLDDAAGEAFDKSARLMGLGYPGGPAIDKQAQSGDPNAVRLPRAWLDGSLNFSFSGLKTAVRRYVESHTEGYSIPDLCASFQLAMIDVLVGKTLQAVEQTGVNLFTVVGGVAANSALKSRMKAAAVEKGVHVLIPPAHYCTDNAGMIACAGYYQLLRGQRDDWDLDAYANASNF
jgi:N6-L-threonylcarbamoyladenine synthase